MSDLNNFAKNHSTSPEKLFSIKIEYTQRLTKLFFTFFERAISLKTNRENIRLNFVPLAERDPAKNIKNTIFKIDLSHNFMGRFINSLSFRNFLRDYNKIDFNSTTRFKNILRKKEFESSIIYFIFLINLKQSVWRKNKTKTISNRI